MAAACARTRYEFRAHRFEWLVEFVAGSCALVVLVLLATRLVLRFRPHGQPWMALFALCICGPPAVLLCGPMMYSYPGETRPIGWRSTEWPSGAVHGAAGYVLPVANDNRPLAALMLAVDSGRETRLIHAGGQWLYSGLADPPPTARLLGQGCRVWWLRLQWSWTSWWELVLARVHGERPWAPPRGWPARLLQLDLCGERPVVRGSAESVWGLHSRLVPVHGGEGRVLLQEGRRVVLLDSDLRSLAESEVPAGHVVGFAGVEGSRLRALVQSQYLGVPPMVLVVEPDGLSELRRLPWSDSDYGLALVKDVDWRRGRLLQARSLDRGCLVEERDLESNEVVDLIVARSAESDGLCSTIYAYGQSRYLHASYSRRSSEEARPVLVHRRVPDECLALFVRGETRPLVEVGEPATEHTTPATAKLNERELLVFDPANRRFKDGPDGVWREMPEHLVPERVLENGGVLGWRRVAGAWRFGEWSTEGALVRRFRGVERRLGSRPPLGRWRPLDLCVDPSSVD